MNVDLSKNGLEAVFTPWQIKTLEILSEGGTFTSFTLTEALNKKLSDGGVSRASVIGFMKELEAYGLASVHLDKGRGGEFRVYEFKHTVRSVTEFIVMLVENWVNVVKLNLSSTKTVTGEGNV